MIPWATLAEVDYLLAMHVGRGAQDAFPIAAAERRLGVRAAREVAEMRAALKGWRVEVGGGRRPSERGIVRLPWISLRSTS